MKNEQMLELRYETDMPAGDQIDYYLSCNVRINKGELKKKEEKTIQATIRSIGLVIKGVHILILIFFHIVRVSMNYQYRDKDIQYERIT